MSIVKSDLIAFKEEVLAEQDALNSEFEAAKAKNEEKIKAFAEALQKETNEKYSIQLAKLDGKILAVDALIEKTPDIETGAEVEEKLI